MCVYNIGLKMLHFSNPLVTLPVKNLVLTIRICYKNLSKNKYTGFHAVNAEKKYTSLRLEKKK